MPHKLSWYRPGRTVVVNDRMQRARYELTEPVGQHFAIDFRPALTPKEMLKHGVFEGKYLADCRDELPIEWFAEAQLSIDAPDISKNYFGVKSRQARSVWLKKGWIQPGDPDPRGWFQWYCRYYLGRRIGAVDARQIARWRAFARHAGQIRKNCPAGDLSCRPRQRQALLQWAYDPFI